MTKKYVTAIREFGTTNDFREAGYLTLDGELLDFSGKHEGGPSGVRNMDHREISGIYDLEGYSSAMCAFVDEGNVRMSHYGFELTQQPTRQREIRLVEFIAYKNGGVYVDFGKIGKHNQAPLGVEYPKGTKATKIISDIRRFYATGEKPQISAMAQFI